MSKQCPVYPKPMKKKASMLFFFFKKRYSWLDGLYERSYFMKMGKVKLPGITLFMPNQPDLVKTILIDEVNNYPKHRILGDMLRPLLGDSIFTTSGEQWRKQRDMLDIGFDNAQVERVFDRMQEAVKRLLSKLNQYPEGEPFNIDTEMTLVTADIIFRTILSADLDEQEALAVIKAFSHYQETSPKLALLWMFNTPNNIVARWLDRKRQRDAKIIRDSIASKILPRYRNFIATGTDSHQDILNSILQAKDPQTNEPFSFEEILNQVSMLFLAGHETSASALTWSLYLLAINPEIQQELREEVMAVLDSDKDSLLTLAQVKKLSMVRKVFMEALRLYPPVGFFVRENIEATQLLDKKIPKQSAILVSPWLLHRHTELWDDPEQFCPMRFDAKASGKPVPKNAYIPFGAGQRVCIGSAFAVQEAVLVLGEFVKQYRITLAAGFVPKPVGRITIRSDNGMSVVLSKL